MNKAEELDKLRRYRKGQPFGWDFRTWETKRGSVLQLGQQRVYYGRCADCGTLVTARRSIEGSNKAGVMSGHMWPERCTDCRTVREKAHDAGATERMRKLRAERKKFRDEQFRKAGLM